MATTLRIINPSKVSMSLHLLDILLKHTQRILILKS